MARCGPCDPVDGTTSIRFLEMDRVAVVTLGVLTKVFDDIVDQKWVIADDVVYTLQNAILLLYVLVSVGDVYFTYGCLFVILLNGGFDHPFWRSLFPVTAVLFLTAVASAWSSSESEWLLFRLLLSTAGVMGVLGVAYMEELAFPEEASQRKMVARGVTVLLMVAMLLLPSFLPAFSVVPIKKTLWIMIGYLVTSVGIQALTLWPASAATDPLAALASRMALARSAAAVDRGIRPTGLPAAEAAHA